MSKRDIVVIGGSAGSIPSMQELLLTLPAELPASLFVVMHLSPSVRSYLAQILGRNAQMLVTEALDGDRIEDGKVYVAQPDRHLLVAADHIHLTRGPKEGLHRPSINVTFRSAAMTYGPRVIGIVLSGLLDDGAAGLWDIAQEGGITIVQDPDEAPFPSMPLNAIADVAVDYRLKAAEIGRMVTDLVNGRAEPRRREAAGAHGKEQFLGFTCPECRGPLYTRETGGPVEFRCRVGHVLSLKTLIDEENSMQERKLYEAIVALEEGADLADFASGKTSGDEAERLQREAVQLRRHSAAIRQIVENRMTEQMR
ncbi:chemotaxis protein CheB [Occallatibacter riparius]|uniref:protein-glutamate methylesterase n=1 Tax=Occallatibacter riparius TaxID=1002689 RepID=A0A9J7BKP6_9BACT|nr:chemotaxis protein CheB [Occallatibacter riparius]UWZ82346.1 chemotaxis protein CheB [Occallatibacter riparius]